MIAKKKNKKMPTNSNNDEQQFDCISSFSRFKWNG
jgi:hypothetical protein